MGFILKEGFSATTIQLTGDSDALIVGNRYRFAPHQGQGFLAFPETSSVKSSECVHALEDYGFSVTRDRGHGVFSITFLNNELSLPQSCTDLDWSNAEILPILPIAGSMLPSCVNTVPLNTTEIGWSGACVVNKLYTPMCSDDRALNYHVDSRETAYTYCKYDQSSGMSVRDIQDIVQIDENGNEPEDYAYVSLEYAPTGVQGEYEFWAILSPEVLPIFIGIVWYWDDNNQSIGAINGPTLTFLPGSTNVVQLNVMVQPNIMLISYATIVVPDEVAGCMDTDANNYNPLATITDGSCLYPKQGCMDVNAVNYSSAASTDDGSCIYTGCMDLSANNTGDTTFYGTNASYVASVEDNTVCTYDAVVRGCTDTTAWNYNSQATIDDGSCQDFIPGCLNPEADNYNSTPGANQHLESACEYYGCTDAAATNTSAATITVSEYFENTDVLSYTYPTGSTISVAVTNDSSICKYDITVETVCTTSENDTGATGQIEENIIYEAYPANDGSGELAIFSGKSCLVDLMATDSHTWAGVTGQKFTEERVRTQVIDCNNTILQLQNPEENAEIVYDLRDLVGSPAITAAFELTEFALEEFAEAAQSAGYTGSITSKAYYYFRIRSSAESLETGFVSSSIGSVEALFSNASNIASVTRINDASFGETTYTVSGSLPAGFAGSNGELLFGYKEGSDEDGNISDNTAWSGAPCNPGGNPEPFYIVYKVEVVDPCVPTSIEFSGNLTCSVSGCTDETATNYTALANIDDGSCTFSGCMDDTYLEYDASVTISSPEDCITPIVYGCTDETATNYNATANINEAGGHSLVPFDAVDWADVLVANHTIAGASDSASYENMVYYYSSPASPHLSITRKLIAGRTYTLGMKGKAVTDTTTAFVSMRDPLGANVSGVGNFDLSTTEILDYADNTTNGTDTFTAGITGDYTIKVKANQNDKQIIIGEFTLIDQSPTDDICLYDIDLETEFENCDELEGHYYLSNGAGSFAAVTSSPNVDFEININDGDILAVGELESADALSTYTQLGSATTVLFAGTAYEHTFVYNTVSRKGFEKCQILTSSNNTLYTGNPAEDGLHTYKLTIRHNTDTTAEQVVENISPVGVELVQEYLSELGFQGTLDRTVSYIFRVDTTSLQYIAGQNTTTLLQHAADSAFPYTFRRAKTLVNVTPGNPFAFGPLNLSATATDAYPEGYVFANGDPSVKTPAYYLYEAVPNNAECSVEQLNLSTIFEDYVDTTIYGCTDSTAANYNSAAQVDDEQCLYYPQGPSGADPIVNVVTTNTGCGWNVTFSVTGANSNNPDHSTWINQVQAGVNITVFQIDVNGDLEEVATGTQYEPCEEGILSPDGVFLTDSWGDEITSAFTTLEELEATSGIADGTNTFQVSVIFSYTDLDPLVLTNTFELEDIVTGCTAPADFNYNPDATCPDGSCIPTVLGCTDTTAFNYDSAANTDDASCISVVTGCTSPTDVFNGETYSSVNYDAAANVDDGSCYICPGMSDSNIFNTSQVTINDAVSVYATSFEWDPNINGANLVDLTLSDTTGVTPTYVSLTTGNPYVVAASTYTYQEIIDGVQFNQFIENAGVIYKLTGISFGATYNGFCGISITNTINITPSEGCISSDQYNYSSTYNYQSTLCIPFIYGCLDSSADNHNSSANTAAECEYEGCTSDWADNYDPTANVDNGSCLAYGCMDDTAHNYNPVATISSTCTYKGCMDDTANNYNAVATIEDNSCTYTGCMDNSATNYYDIATTEGPCTYVGCTNPAALNFNIATEYQTEYEYVYDSSSILSEGSTIVGCSDCCVIGGCMESWAMNYNALTTDQTVDCILFGCTSDWATNYNSNATNDDGSCFLNGCTDVLADNYNINATADNGTCTYNGCMLEDADNFDPDANFDDGTCALNECIVPGQFNYNSDIATAVANYDGTLDFDSTCYPFISGCLDPTANNYIPLIFDTSVDANTSDGSCCDNIGADHIGTTILDGDDFALSTGWGLGITASGLNLGTDMYGLQTYVLSLESTDVTYTTASRELTFTESLTMGTPYTFKCLVNSAAGATVEVSMTSANGETDSSGSLVLSSPGASYITLSLIWDGSLTLDISGISNTAPLVITEMYAFETQYILPTLYNLNCVGTPYTFIAWDENYSTIEPTGVTNLTIQSETTAGAVLFTDSNVSWADLVQPVEILDSSIYSGWTAASADYSVVNTSSDVTITAISASTGVGGSVPLSTLLTGTGITYLSTGSTSNVYALEFTLVSDDPNAIVEIYDSISTTVLASNVSDDLIFSVPSGSEDAIEIRVNNLDGTYHATLSNLSLKKAFPIGLYNGSALAQNVIVSFNYNNAGGASTGCSYSQTLVISNTCGTPVSGCTDNGSNPNAAGIINDINGDGLAAFNYNPLANLDDGTCIAAVFGCTDNGTAVNGAGIVNDLLSDGLASFNYDPLANTDDGTCYPVIEGCMDITSHNYIQLTDDANIDVNTDNGSCYGNIPGCTDVDAVNYNDTDGDGIGDPLTGDTAIDINTEDGSCCYDYIADDGSHEYSEVILPKFYWGEAELIDNSITVADEAVYAHARLHVYKSNISFPDAAKESITSIVVTAKNGANTIDTATVSAEAFEPTISNEKVDPSSGGVLLHAYKYNLDGTNYGTTSLPRPSTDIVSDPNVATSISIDVTYTTLDGSPCTFTITHDLTSDITDVSTGDLHDTPKSLYGCTDSNYLEYWLNPTTTPISANAFVDDGSCATAIIAGCMNTTYEEYYAAQCVIQDSLAPSGYDLIDYLCVFTDISAGQQTYLVDWTMVLPNFNDPTLCINALDYHPNNCTDPAYVAFYNGPDGEGMYGTATGTSTLFYPGQVLETTGCGTELVVEGCYNELDANGNTLVDYDVNASLYASSTCSDDYYGCTNSTFLEYDADADVNDSSMCITSETFGCHNPLYLEYDINTTTSDQDSCINLIVVGCQNIIYCNYNPEANTDPEEGSATACAGLAGCSDNTYTENYIGITSAVNSAGDPIYTITEDLEQYSCELTGLEGALCNTQLVYGCTDPSKIGYDSSANIDDGSCGDIAVEGCMNPNAFNYNALANINDGSCEDIVEGCLDDTMFNYNPDANTSDGSCIVSVEGCTNAAMFNYDVNSTTDDGSCYPIVTGCMDVLALNYNNSIEGDITYIPFAGNILTDVNTNNSHMCIAAVNGCMDEAAENYNELATTDDGTCTYILGCMDEAAYNYAAGATENDGTCLYCDSYVNTTTTVVAATTILIADGSITINIPEGLEVASITWEQDGEVMVSAEDTLTQTGLAGGMYTLTILDSSNSKCDNTILEVEVPVIGIGCTDETADNYCEGCTIDDGSCFYTIYGCTDSTATNYDEEATVSDGTCEYLTGCTDPEACNFVDGATISSVCTYAAPFRDCDGVCDDPSLIFDGLCNEEVTADCIDPNAANFVGAIRTIKVPNAAPGAPVAVPTTVADDGSCVYNNECQPKDILKILDALSMTVADHGKTSYTHLKTGMLDNEAVFNLWRLILIDHLLQRKGSKAVFNCQDFDQTGHVTYGGDNYLDKFLTFAFKMGEDNFASVKKSTTTYKSGSKTTKK